MRISDVSIKNPVFAWMIFAACIVFGYISYSRMGVSQMPDVDFPVVNVSFSLLGAAPEIMETTVVDPVEDALSSVSGIRNISSVSKTGQANITVEFELDRDIDAALQEVQTKIAQAQRLLPTDVDPPVISKTNPDDSPIIWLALTYDKNDSHFLMKYAKDYLKNRFTTVQGVGDIILGGYTDPALRVWIKPEALTRYNISVEDVLGAIKSEHSEMPGGFIQTSRNAFNVRTMGEAKTVEEFGELVISKRAGQLIQDPTNMVKLKQVAHIEEALAQVFRVSRFNEVPALGIGIKKQLGSNSVAVARAVKQKMLEVREQLPNGMHLNVNWESTRFVENSIHEMIKHLMLAVILTSLVCWIFLGSWSATLNVLLSIPTSIMGAFVGLYFFGFTLNTFTLLGLTLAIGIVVDDAIMVLENIFRYNEKGKGKIESAIIGAREIAFAAMAASVAVVAIFLPVAFMKGIIGKFFLQFGVTISLAVMLSLMESLTITPMRCATFVNKGERTTKLGRAFEALMQAAIRGYGRLLTKVLRFRWPVVIGSVIFVVASFYCVKFMIIEMTPTQDQSLFMTRLTLPVGTSLAYTNEQASKAEKYFLSQPEIKQVYCAVGGAGGGASGASDANTVTMFVTMKDLGERGKDAEKGRELTQQEFMAKARKELAKIPDVKPFMMDLSSRGFGTGRGYPIEFVIQGPDWNKLAELSKKLKEEMAASGMMTDIDTDYRDGMPEVQIVPDRMKAALHGVSIQSIGNTVNALIGGVKNGQFPQDGHRYDIWVALEQSADPQSEIKNLLIGNSKNNLIPISKVTKIDSKESLQQITRVNRQRAITMYANLTPGSSQQKALEFITKKGKELPGTYFIEQSGAARTFKESWDSLVLALILGVFVAYMVLASQFNSFLDPIAILVALPFSVSGAFFALLISKQSLNMYSAIGLLLLMGIVKKNSILLIEFTNLVRERGVQDPIKALIEACPVRLRPIIMTSAATIAAAIPSALARGAGAETFRPMAVTLIGGVFVSTILTLFVVPCVYSLLDGLSRRSENSEEVKKAFQLVGNEALEGSH